MRNLFYELQEKLQKILCAALAAVSVSLVIVPVSYGSAGEFMVEYCRWKDLCNCDGFNF
jgi:hypothetical protein